MLLYAKSNTSFLLYRYDDDNDSYDDADSCYMMMIHDDIDDADENDADDT